MLRNLPPEGKILYDVKTATNFFKKDYADNFTNLIIFVYRWGRSKTMVLIAEDSKGLLSDILSNFRFNAAFWPSLESNLRTNAEHKSAALELDKIKNDYSKSKKEFMDLNRELNKKILDINSFVEISEKMYSLYDEEKLTDALKKIISTQLRSPRVELIFPDEDGKFVLENDNIDKKISLRPETELFEYINSNKKPALLPIISSGLSGDDPFLNNAMKNGFVLISMLFRDDKAACLILVAETKDSSQFNNMSITQLSVISNIASLAFENISQYKTIEKLSHTDSMTGVYNHRYFKKRLREEINRASRFSRENSLVILDIDKFKQFNDQYGHQTGDFVLKKIAELISRVVRSIDVVCRYGGEEFCIIMPDTGAENCVIFMERLRQEIAETKFEAEQLNEAGGITVSIGGAVYPEHASTLDKIIYCADMALLRAKALGRNKTILFSPEIIENEDTSIGRIDDTN